MKILHINCNYAETALHGIMIKELKAIGIQSTIFCPVLETAKRYNTREGEYIIKCFKKIDRILYFRKQKKIYKTISKKIDIKNENYSLIHAHTLMTDGYLAYRLSRINKIPYIVAIRDTDINAFFKYKPYLRPLGIRIMRHAKAIIFISNAYKKNVINKYIPNKYKVEIANKSFVIPNGIDDFWLNNNYDNKNRKRQITKDRLSIICVGKINKRKNIPMVQKAIRLLEKKNWNVDFTVIGKVENKKEYETIIKDKNTKYHKPMEKEKLIDYYRKADIFVLASHTETFGLVYAEAMSQGLPVIYTRNQGFDGFFTEGKVGYSVSDKNPYEIADKIESICKSYANISLNATTAVKIFNWHDICKRYCFIYQGAINA